MLLGTVGGPRPRANLGVMARSAAAHKMTASEFLAWEREQPERFEFAAGEAFAMAGGSPRHNLLAAAAAAILRAEPRGRCSVLSSDQKIHLAATGQYVYADATVVCGQIVVHAGSSDVIDNPTAIVEVLSKRTEACDRGGKWEGYAAIPSLVDYILRLAAHASGRTLRSKRRRQLAVHGRDRTGKRGAGLWRCSLPRGALSGRLRGRR